MLSRPFHELYVIAQRADWFFSYQRYDWSGVLTFFEGQLYGSKKTVLLFYIYLWLFQKRITD